MKKLIIEWKHYNKKGNTCDRCSKTGVSLRKAIGDLKKELEAKGIRILLKETKLSEKEIKNSNLILFNGIPLEDLVGKMNMVKTPCHSCCELIGAPINCRAISYQGQTIEDIPIGLIKKAVKSFLRKENSPSLKLRRTQ